MVLNYYKDHRDNFIMLLVLTPQPSEICLGGQFDPQTERSERGQQWENEVRSPYRTICYN